MSAASHSPLAFVCGHRKSGTTLLSNLLDGHPQLAVYPNDLALLYAYFPDFIRARCDAGARRERLRHILFDDLADRLARLARSDKLDVEALADRFFQDLPDADLAQLRTLIARLMSAFQAISKAQTSRWGVLKETSIEIYAAEILQWFPEARFIQVLRDPRDNFAALAAGVESHYGRLGEDRNRTLASLLHRARLGFRMARLNRAAFGPERYHLVRFEDLTAEPEQHMKGVAEFLDIRFDTSLLAPTLLGMPVGGNSYDGISVFTVSARNAGRWRDRIAPEDAQVVEFHLADEMREFGYAPAFAPETQARAAAEFYKWQNYAYFYSDRFAQAVKP